MNGWAVVFLGLIALASLTQVAALIVLAFRAQAMERRLTALTERFERDLRPSLESVARIARNAEEISDLAVLQMRRVDEVVADTSDKLRETTALIQRTVVRPLGPLVDLAAFLKGLRRGLEVYQQLRGFERGNRAPARSYDTEDEHLFI